MYGETDEVVSRVDACPQSLPCLGEAQVKV
jgi:hypothetical protein